jgi:AbrB family looped-hinge helix DNA binding protein
MAKVTSKLQVTLPKRIAEAHGISPGDQIEFESSGDDIRIVTESRKQSSVMSREERLRLFDETTLRIEDRSKHLSGVTPPSKRDWQREDLYRRGSSD